MQRSIGHKSASTQQPQRAAQQHGSTARPGFCPALQQRSSARRGVREQQSAWQPGNSRALVTVATAAAARPTLDPTVHSYREPSQWPTEDEMQLAQHDLAKQPYVDLVVAGAGPAGVAVAERVARAGFSVCVVDAEPLAHWPNNYGVWVDEFTGRQAAGHLLHGPQRTVHGPPHGKAAQVMRHACQKTASKQLSKTPATQQGHGLHGRLRGVCLQNLCLSTCSQHVLPTHMQPACLPCTRSLRPPITRPSPPHTSHIHQLLTHHTSLTSSHMTQRSPNYSHELFDLAWARLG